LQGVELRMLDRPAGTSVDLQEVFGAREATALGR